MIQDRLMINDDKTEFLLVGTRQQLDKQDSCSITVGNNRISPSPCVKNLGSLFDSNLSMTDHINKACNAAFYHLHNLRRIKKYLSRDSLIILVHAFITCRLDYCNGLLFGLTKTQLLNYSVYKMRQQDLFLASESFLTLHWRFTSCTGCRFLCVLIIRFYF